MNSAEQPVIEMDIIKKEGKLDIRLNNSFPILFVNYIRQYKNITIVLFPLLYTDQFDI